MPRLTVIDDELAYKHGKGRYERDPGAFRSAEDLCTICSRVIDPVKVARRHNISVEWAREQISGLAEEIGHWPDYHPVYNTTDYHCAHCGRRLTNYDD